MSDLTTADFAQKCAHIAGHCASWAGDLLTLPERRMTPADIKDVARFTDSIRDRLDHLDRIFGRVQQREVDEWNRRAALAHDEQAEPAHADDIAVDRFAAAMKAKLAQKRAEGRGGWDDPEQCSIALLSRLLVEHIDKGDPVDVGNLAMMIHQRGGSIASDRERYADQQAQRALRADELESLQRAFSSAPPAMLEPGSNCPPGFVWIDQPVTVKGGDYTYAGQLLLSFPKSVGGAVRYIVRDGNNRLFIHNARQCGIEE